MGDREIIVAVEVLRVLLDAAFTYAEINKIPQEHLEEAWLKSYAKIDEFDPETLPKIGDD